MWFNNYGDSFNSEEDAREDANYMMDWQDYEEQILKNDHHPRVCNHYERLICKYFRSRLIQKHSRYQKPCLI